VFGERCGRCRLVAIVLALAGSSLIFGAPTAGGSDLVAKGLGLVAAAGAAVYYVAGARGVAPAQALQGAALLCLSGALVFAPLCAAGAGSSRQVAETWPYLALIGVTGTALPLLMAQAGMARIGSTPAALLSLLEPVVVVVLALAILGERMGVLQLAGTLLSLASLPLASIERIADVRGRLRSACPRALR
jgi:drug/metabolite transporter (DMT)-like permease